MSISTDNQTERVTIRREPGRADGPFVLFLNGTAVDKSKYRITFHDFSRSLAEGFGTWVINQYSGAVDTWPIGGLDCHILDSSVAKQVGTYRFDDISPTFGIISLPYFPSWNPSIDRLYIVGRPKIDGPQSGVVESIVFCFTIWPEKWAYPYTMLEYAGALRSAADETVEYISNDFFWTIGSPYHDDEDHHPYPFLSVGFALKWESSNGVIEEQISRCSEQVRALCAKAKRSLLHDRKDALVTFFDFPEQLRSACEQYLIYFVQFLDDLGIRADSELKQHAGSVLFSVVPKDGPSALADVKNALEIYLQLPDNLEFREAASQLSDVAVAQLQANVFFLRSQLELARAVVQAKDATIQSLNFTVFQQQQLLTASVAGLPTTPRPHDEEPLLGNSVYVTKYEGKGFGIDLPRILRRLKRVVASGTKSD